MVDIGCLTDKVNILGNRLPHPDGFENGNLTPLVDVNPLAGKVDRIDGITIKFRGGHRSQDGGKHHRHNNHIVTGHLEEEKNCGHGGMGRGGQKGPDTDGGIGPGGGRILRQQVMDNAAKGSTDYGPDKQGRGKHAAGPAGTKRDSGGNGFQSDQGQHHPDNTVPGQGLFNILIAITHNLGKGNTDAAHQKGTDQGFDLGMDRQGLKLIADKIKKTDMDNRQQTDDQGHDGIQRHLHKGIDHVIIGNGKGRNLSVICPRNNGCHRRGNDECCKRGDLVGAEQDYFGGKKDTGNGGIEDTGNPTRATGGHIDLHPGTGDPELLADLGPQGTADLGNGPFHTGRIAGANGQGGGGYLDKDIFAIDHPIFQVHPAQEPGKAVPIHLAGKEERQGNEQEHAEHGDKRQQ